MTNERKKIYLIDGSGYIYRAFYAIPQMTRPSDNVPVNAVYGFTSMLMQFFGNNDADCLAVVFDAKKKNFRHDIYQEYKANRKETPAELAPQFPIIREVVKSFNVVSVEEEGFEADDLIATYTREALAQEMDVVIVSADKDLTQLMRPHVSVYDPMKKRMLTPEDVTNKFGVTPDKIVDVQALAGDASDNVPGVAGIGIKTAADIINQFGSLENLLKNTAQITPNRRRELIEKERDKAIISKQLVTLDEHAPMPKPLSDFCINAPVQETVRAFLEANNFKSLLTRLSHSFSSKRTYAPPPAQKVYTLVQDKETLTLWAHKIKEAGLVALDTETDSLNILTAQIAGISLSVKEGEACYIPLNHEDPSKISTDLFNINNEQTIIKQLSSKDIQEILMPVLTDQKITKIGHNIKFDLHTLQTNFGADINLLPIQDTMVMAYDLDGAAHSLSMDTLANLYLNIKTIPYEDVCGHGKTAIAFKYVSLDKALMYAAEDADITLRLYNYLVPKLQQNGMDTVYHNIDLPLIPVLADMESRGILVDKGALEKASLAFLEKMTTLESEIYTLAGTRFNINSPAQLGEILFGRMQLEGGKKNTKTGAWSTEHDALETLAEKGEKLPEKILEYRQYSKLKSTYADALTKLLDTKTNRVHTNFSQTITTTGRLSSNNPNLQNIPIRSEAGQFIRSAFIARQGYVLLSADYSQVELRLIADVANIAALKLAFEENKDIHAVTASQVFHVPLEQMDAATRRKAKAINFGIIYGISAFGLARQLDISRAEAKEYIDNYMAQYPEIKKYMDDTVNFAKEHGYVMTPFGRKCFISGFGKEATRGFAARSAINAPIQGGAADIIKMAMNKMASALAQKGLSAQMLLQVHDELIFEVPENEAQETKKVVQDIMENVVKLSVPLVVEVGIGHNWTDAH